MVNFPTLVAATLIILQPSMILGLSAHHLKKFLSEYRANVHSRTRSRMHILPTAQIYKKLGR
jgi:hypothetical protein